MPFASRCAKPVATPFATPVVKPIAKPFAKHFAFRSSRGGGSATWHDDPKLGGFAKGLAKVFADGIIYQINISNKYIK